MPKAESKSQAKSKSNAGNGDEEEGEPPVEKSSSSAALSLRLAARLKKKVTQTRKALDEEDPERVRMKEAEKRRNQIHRLLDHPKHSQAAFMVCAVIFIMIILSTAFCLAETLPYFENKKWRYRFWIADIIFVIFFTVEYMLRCWAAPMSLRDFVLQPLNVIDLIALIPFFIEFVVWLFFTSAHSNEFFTALQLIRVLRFIRVGRFSDEMIFIAEGLVRSVQSFFLMSYLLTAGLILSSTLLFMLERGEWDSGKGCYVRENEVYFSGCSPYESVPMASWWAITTMTTVGFGDAYPLTVAGRISCGFTMVCGLLCIAIPTTVLGVEFAQAYAYELAQKKASGVRKTLVTRSKDELVLYQSMVKLNCIKEELQVHLPYLKHLVMADFEVEQDEEDHPVLDPTFSLFHSNVLLNFNNLKLFAEANTQNLII